MRRARGSVRWVVAVLVSGAFFTVAVGGEPDPDASRVTILAAKAGVPIVLDRKSLATMGLDPDVAVTARLTGRSFRAGLRDVLGDADLGRALRR